MQSTTTTNHFVRVLLNDKQGLVLTDDYISEFAALVNDLGDEKEHAFAICSLICASRGYFKGAKYYLKLYNVEPVYMDTNFVREKT